MGNDMVVSISFEISHFLDFNATPVLVARVSWPSRVNEAIDEMEFRIRLQM